MIHLARPYGGGSYCGAIGDIRWAGGKWTNTCPSCARAHGVVSRRERETERKRLPMPGKDRRSPFLFLGDHDVAMALAGNWYRHGRWLPQRWAPTAHKQQDYTFVPCRSCGAGVRERCRTKSGKPLAKTAGHSARKRLFKEVAPRATYFYNEMVDGERLPNGIRCKMA